MDNRHGQIPERIMLCVSHEPMSGCWLWDRGVSKNGYGNINMKGFKNIAAHRYFYEQIVGPIPEGLFLDHKCCVKSCVNPDHLHPVTHAENLRLGAFRKHNGMCKKHNIEMSRRKCGDLRCVICLRENSARSYQKRTAGYSSGVGRVLNTNKVIKIRELHSQGKTLAFIANEVGCSISTVSHLMAGKIQMWRNK